MAYRFSTHTSVIVIPKMKGGVASTHMAMALAAEAARRGAETGILDADTTTKGALRWFSTATTDNPDAEPPYSMREWLPHGKPIVQDAINFAKEYEMDVLIIDMGADKDRLIEVAKLADLFAAPTSTTSDELASHAEAHDIARGLAPQTPWVTILTRVKVPHRGEAAVARQELSERRNPITDICPVEIKRHDQYSSMFGRFADDVLAYRDVMDYLEPHLKNRLPRPEDN